ncbi:MAG: hypothetical protein QGG36_02660 [Pirellulaceae bacterium]|nr:hypothetical protein [Pirellulaceae bacterium]
MRTGAIDFQFSRESTDKLTDFGASFEQIRCGHRNDVHKRADARADCAAKQFLLVGHYAMVADGFVERLLQVIRRAGFTQELKDAGRIDRDAQTFEISFTTQQHPN